MGGTQENALRGPGLFAEATQWFSESTYSLVAEGAPAVGDEVHTQVDRGVLRRVQVTGLDHEDKA